MKNQREDVAQAERPIKFPRADGGQFGIGRRIFRRAENRPEHRAHERRRADVKREPDGTGHMACPAPSEVTPNQLVIIHGKAEAMVPPRPMNRD
jgi:hypothetical protein